MPEYDFWAVDCKTEGCDSQIFLYCMGLHSPRIAHFLQFAPETIEVPCPGCGRSYRYTQDEVQARIGPEPPFDFVPHPFLRNPRNQGRV
jgi:hypothetical protein